MQYHSTPRFFSLRMILILVLLCVGGIAAEAQVTQVIGLSDGLILGGGLATDDAGNLYVTGIVSDNVLKLAPGGALTELIDSTGDGINGFDQAIEAVVDAAGNVYVVGVGTQNAFKITPGGIITQIIDQFGDGAGHSLPFPLDIAVDGLGNVYVTGFFSANAFKIEPGGTITEIIDSTGGGLASVSRVAAVEANAGGTVWVTAVDGVDSIFEIAPGGGITRIFDETGDGVNACDSGINDLKLDSAGNLYVVCTITGNAFRIEPGGAITQLIDATGDGAGNILDRPTGIAVDDAGNVYVSGFGSHNAFRIEPGGTITEIIDETGDGLGNTLEGPNDIVFLDGFVYVVGQSSHNVFKIVPPPPVSAELSVATDIPAVEGGSVDVPVVLTTNGLSAAGTSFSIDYDESCLTFDATDTAPADGIPDSITVDAPADFTPVIFHDLGDSDGELDVALADVAPPVAVFSDGPLITVTFQVNPVCMPAPGGSINAPVVFSTDPSPTISDETTMDVLTSSTDGSVQILAGPRADCNGNGTLSIGDMIAEGLEIVDGDGAVWSDADDPSGTFAGSPVGCDSNADLTIDAGDITCTAQQLFGAACGSPLTGSARPTLAVDGSEFVKPGNSVWVPVLLQADRKGHEIGAVAFSLDINQRTVRFDPSDQDGDGLPDAIRFPGDAPNVPLVRWDARDQDGELDIVLANFGRTLEAGVVIEIRLESLGVRSMARGVRFSKDLPTSFGTLDGASVPGSTRILGPGVR